MTIDIDEAKVRRNETGLWLGWTLATVAGLFLAFVPPALLLTEVPLWIARILIPLLAGFLVGLFQWLVLRNYLTHSVDWILNGGAGWALGYALGLIVIQLLSRSFLGAILGYILFGVIIALVQWPVLRREIPQALPWVIACVVGWGLGALLSQFALSAFPPDPAATNPALTSAVVALITGLVAGAVTGFALIRITRAPEY